MNENMLERINLPLTIGKEHRKETDSRISRLFLESGNLENIYRKLPGMLADRFGFRHVLIERYHPDSDSLAIEGVEWDGYSKTDFNKIPVIDTVFSRAIRSGRTEFLQPDEIDAGDAHPLINGPGIREIICIPLKAKSMVLGMLILAGDQPVGESKKTMVSLKLISHHLSLEIEQENSRFQLIQAQSLLKRQNQIFESIFSTTHFMLAYMDTQFNFIRVNKAYADAAGKSVHDFEGQNHFTLFPSPENQEIFTRVVNTGEPFIAEAKPFIFPDDPAGALTYWNWTLQPIKTPQGEVEHLLLELVDVTMEKRAREERAESERIYRELKEKTLDGYVRANLEGNFESINQAFTDMTGYTEQDLSQMSLSDITPRKWRSKEKLLLKKLYLKGYTPLYEKEYVKKDGTIVPVELRSYLIKDAEGRAVGQWAFVRDITRRKKTEDDMKIYAKKLEESNKALQEFVYSASHDLQEPLRKIKTFGGMLFRLVGPDFDQTGKDYLERMISASERMRHLIQELLNYSRISNKAIQLIPVDLNTVLGHVLSNIETLLEKTNCRIDIGNLPQIDADPTRMMQLFQNLLVNAVKFQPAGSIPRITVGFTTKSFKTHGEAKAPGRFYEIFVRDNGIGIDEKQMHCIFAPFHRLHGRMEYEGVGMGLAICKKIVELHKGMIFAENNREGGTTFKIRLPQTHE